MPLSKESIERAYRAFASTADGKVVLEDLEAQFGASSVLPKEPDRYGRFIGNLEVVQHIKAMMEGKDEGDGG